MIWHSMTHPFSQSGPGYHVGKFTYGRQLISQETTVGDMTTLVPEKYTAGYSKTFLDIAKDLNLEQVANFSTRLQNTLDLVFMSHLSFKIRCKRLPPIGLKSDHHLALHDTSIQPVRTRLPRRKIHIWKKAN